MDEDVVVRANHNPEWSDVILEDRDWLRMETVVVIEPITIARLNLPPFYRLLFTLLILHFLSKTIQLTLEFYLINV